MRTFHLPLPEYLHDALRAEARDERRPATELVRQALEGWLAERRKRRLADDIRSYAQAAAGTEDDLDPALEAAGVESLLGDRAAP